jgi:hypothetical protein
VILYFSVRRKPTRALPENSLSRAIFGSLPDECCW